MKYLFQHIVILIVFNPINKLLIEKLRLVYNLMNSLKGYSCFLKPIRFVYF